MTASKAVGVDVSRRKVMRAIAAGVLAMANHGWAAESVNPSAGAVRPLPPGQVHMVPALPSSADPLPHELRPNEWPQPDYFNEALKLTRFAPGDSVKSLKLVGPSPALLVMPVQNQVYGWIPAFNAVVGASLDSELAARGLEANRQVDLFDADGPFVRRFDEAAVTAFVAQHGNAPVLALYLGRDGAGKSLVTLTLRGSGKLQRAHRAVDEHPDPKEALDRIAGTLPAMLDELGLAGQPRVPGAAVKGCQVSDWTLAEPAPGAGRGARACQALILGVLLPEFERATTSVARPRTPAKLAWLAQAYAEAAALEPDTATALRAIAWSQLELADALEKVAQWVDSGDPVIRPLARLLWAPEHARRGPARSTDRAAIDYVAADAEKLPPFARAAYIERLSIQEQFRRVDLCALELQLPFMRVPAYCDAPPQGSVLRTQVASRGERALLQEWRLAHAYKDLQIQAVERGDPVRRQAVLDAMPARLAAHPFIRYKRFATERLDASKGEYASLVQRARASVSDFVQATADLQRYDRVLNNNAVSYGRGVTNSALRADPQISVLIKDEQRMIAVLDHDGFMMRSVGLKKVADSGRLSFLRSGELITVRPMPAVMVAAPAPSVGATAPAIGAVVPTGAAPLFDASAVVPSRDSKALERALATDPLAMLPRVHLALAQLKQGQPMEQARKVIDARPAQGRVDRAIDESHEWSEPAHMLLFAGEVDAARDYYERVVRIGTGSASDLLARAQLRRIAGDVAGAQKATRVQLERYENDYARRDLAGLEFMLGQVESGWAVLRPRLSLSGQMLLWVGAMAGHRMQGLRAHDVHEWIARSNYGHAQINGLGIGTVYLGRYVTEDRIPTDGDVTLLANLDYRSSEMTAFLVAKAHLHRLALAERVDDGDMALVRNVINRATWSRRATLKALYAWAARRAGQTADKSLSLFNSATIDEDLDAVLAKAVLLGLDNQPADAIRFLRAARFELANLASGEGLRDEVRSASYTVALMGYLLFSKTGHGAYRDEALKVAHAYQRADPFLAWPYALTALLSPSGAARTASACRAQYLDKESQFLKLSGLKPATAALPCPSQPW